MAFVYILRCSDDSYYVGSTTHLDLRLAQRQAGVGAEYTRRRRPVELAWSAHFDSVAEAYSFEKRVQGWSRRKREALMEGRYDDLPGLSSRGHAAVRARAGFRDGP
ncbi:GIY-YIG nuclease family protein [Marmoricola sp. RAF53]|uniref:GIY-YIG nuclease family protein n=1 Tax=Marmoricola sp. RAF53 TaxID=3233059 RepID=UPI003F96F9A6